MGGRKPRTLSRQLLADIIEPRVEEIFTLVRNEIIRSGYEDILASGIVITGGSALMEGMPELGEQIFNLPVRRGDPAGIGGLVDVVNSPIYATGVGLVLHGNKEPGKSRFKMGDENIFTKVTKRMKDWFNEYF
jgi:cell division protein FtsA